MWPAFEADAAPGASGLGQAHEALVRGLIRSPSRLAPTAGVEPMATATGARAIGDSGFSLSLARIGDDQFVVVAGVKAVVAV